MREQQPAILCLSHLNWSYIWQRPQHVLSRMARYYEVMYVDEPDIGPADGERTLERVAREGKLSAWHPIFPDRSEIVGPWREQYVDIVRELLLRKEWVEERAGRLVAIRPLILWFYTPTPVYLLDHLPADLVVYDVMDELDNFKGGPVDLKAREARLLARADVVFAGGRSLYQAREGRHPNLHLFPSGVEPDHFARATHPETPVAGEIADLPRPILGYYGAIDERIDLELLQAVAERHPEWSIVMIGPVVKIEPDELPRLPNIHYLGRQSYSRLPSFLKGFDVCLMPFAMNEATRYISPTKTLEYMAAHKPIVSTPVPDVVASWGEMVRIAATPEAFAGAVEDALQENEAQRSARVVREEHILACSTWDHIVAQMHERIEAVLKQRPTHVGSGAYPVVNPPCTINPLNRV
ncbi:MAG: glycosyltransferase [Chloroflexota bacterium]|nr:glycosyltransferase [Chloroflexota bacterium]